MCAGEAACNTLFLSFALLKFFPLDFCPQIVSKFRHFKVIRMPKFRHTQLIHKCHSLWDNHLACCTHLVSHSILVVQNCTKDTLRLNLCLKCAKYRHLSQFWSKIIHINGHLLENRLPKFNGTVEDTTTRYKTGNWLETS